MLNISKYRISDRVDHSLYDSLQSFEDPRKKKFRRYLFLGVLLVIIIVMFLPWTQNIQAKGYVTSLQPGQRPQGIPSLIPGRIEEWFVQEGEFVKAGDTIVHISEIKDEYFDPALLDRTQKRVQAKEASIESYREKVLALNAQIDALKNNLQLKLEQAQNKFEQANLKVVADSIDLKAAETNLSISVDQLQRMESLYQQGLKSKTDLETRRMKLQEAQAKVISQESKLLSSKNDVINAAVEINSIRADFQEKLGKAQSDRFSTLSNLYDAQAELAKVQNQMSNYAIRSGFYYITAPQDGYITQAVQTGIGATVKEGESVVTIMPADYQLAVEMYVRPLDLPLINRGQDVRIQFDGWPAIVFSGWPGISTGTFTGEVVAIDNFTNREGLYRVLIKPDPETAEWPEGIRVGAGARTFTLLKNVQIWYEIWRQINGFPPDYYKGKVQYETETQEPKLQQKKDQKE